jgi:hypothetical protein
VTSSGLPANSPTTMPPTMPVIRPTAAAFSAGTPEAIAMPMHSGSATRNTTTDANRSCFHAPGPRQSADFAFVFALIIHLVR